MPIIIPQDLPATDILVNENIFVMNDGRASQQDIRPLKIAIVNLMPIKSVTETQLLRMLSNFPVQIHIDLVTTETYQSRNTPEEHLKTFYKSFDEIRHCKYDGMIITGAPVEKMRYGEVSYWDEFTEIMDFSINNVTSTFHICWAGQAAMFHHFGIHNYITDEKVFGVFRHQVRNQRNELMRGFDDVFYAPHSRHAEIIREELENTPELEILADSPEGGIYLVASKDKKLVFCNGHSEYDAGTLRDEYQRDLNKGLTDVKLPLNYFPDDNPDNPPLVTWRSHGHLLYTNWLNYYVYQETPFDLYQSNRRNGGMGK